MNWYGLYESHEADEVKEGTCPIGIMQLGTNNTDEDHDVSHECTKEDEHIDTHMCSCGKEFD